MAIRLEFYHPVSAPKWAWITIFLTGLVAGCSTDADPPIYPVEGKAFFRGKPAVAAQVFLHPVGDTTPGNTRPTGVVDEDGTFRLSTFRAYDGAPPGSYRLSIVWLSDAVKEGDENVGPDRLRGKYRDAAKNPWTVTVGPGSNTIERLELR